MSLTTSASSPLAASLPRAHCDRLRAVLGGEADQRLPVAALPRRARRARRRSARARAPGAAVGLLDLARRGRSRREVGDRGGHQQHVAGGELLLAGLLQLGRGDDLAPGNAGGRRQRDVGGDQRHLRRPARGRPARARSPCARRSCCRRSGRCRSARGCRPAVTSTLRPCSERGVTRALPRSGRRCAVGRCSRALAQRLARRPRAPVRARPGARRPARPWRPAARRPARRRSPRARAASQVGLRGGVLVHAVVHRRREHQRAGGRERAAAQQVVGEPRGELGDRVRRGRRDQDRGRRWRPARGG